MMKHKTNAAMYLSMAAASILLSCGQESGPVKEQPDFGHSTESDGGGEVVVPTLYPGTPGECSVDEDCEAVVAYTQMYRNPESVACIIPEHGQGKCSECLTDEDCVGSLRCINETFCFEWPKEEPDECFDDAHCREVLGPMRSGGNYLNPENLICLPDLGAQFFFCSECLADVDCPEGSKCASPSYCTAP